MDTQLATREGLIALDTRYARLWQGLRSSYYVRDDTNARAVFSQRDQLALEGLIVDGSRRLHAEGRLTHAETARLIQRAARVNAETPYVERMDAITRRLNAVQLEDTREC